MSRSQTLYCQLLIRQKFYECFQFMVAVKKLIKNQHCARAYIVLKCAENKDRRAVKICIEMDDELRSRSECFAETGERIAKPTFVKQDARILKYGHPSAHIERTLVIDMRPFFGKTFKTVEAVKARIGMLQ